MLYSQHLLWLTACRQDKRGQVAAADLRWWPSRARQGQRLLRRQAPRSGRPRRRPCPLRARSPPDCCAGSPLSCAAGSLPAPVQHVCRQSAANPTAVRSGTAARCISHTSHVLHIRLLRRMTSIMRGKQPAGTCAPQPGSADSFRPCKVTSCCRSM